MDGGDEREFSRFYDYTNRYVRGAGFNESDSDAYQILGDLKINYYTRQEEAEADFVRAVELSPNDPFVLDYRGYRLADSGENYAEAIRLLRRAVAIEPTHQLLHNHLGLTTVYRTLLLVF